MNERAAKRMAAELRMLQREPPPGISAWPVGDRVDQLEAVIEGPSETVYEGGAFKLSIVIPERYPLEPPKVQFVTPIHHPNIDNNGRICLDILNMPPKGAYKPSLNLCTVLQSIGQLMRYPNPDDGLMVEITREYRHDRAAFDARARQMTRRFAMATDDEPLLATDATAAAANDDVDNAAPAVSAAAAGEAEEADGETGGAAAVLAGAGSAEGAAAQGSAAPLPAATAAAAAAETAAGSASQQQAQPLGATEEPKLGDEAENVPPGGAAAAGVGSAVGGGKVVGEQQQAASPAPPQPKRSRLMLRQ